MLQGRNAFEVLGIEQTSDIKIIKKAYADLVKQYHPEEDAANWKKVHDAYQEAMQYAKGRSSLEQEYFVPEEVELKKAALQKELTEEEKAQAQETEELLESLSYGRAAICSAKRLSMVECEELERTIEELRELAKKTYSEYKDWNNFFGSDSYRMVRGFDGFLPELEKVLGWKVIRNVEILARIQQELEEIKKLRQSDVFGEYGQEKDETIQNLDNRLQNMRFRLEPAARQEKEKTTRSLAFVFVIIILVIAFYCNMG